MDRFDDLIKSKIVEDLDEESLLHLEQVGGAFGPLVKRRIKEIEESDDFPDTADFRDIRFCCRHRLLISLRHHTRGYNLGLYGACEGGHLDICNLMIEKGANNWNGGLRAACGGGNLDICNLMIAKGANCWNWGLNAACGRGHSKIIALMISKGATHCENFFYSCNRSLSEHLIINYF